MGEQPAQRRPTVLVADDEPSIREVLADGLAREGYDVVTAADGIEACEISEACPPEVALLDLLLPRRDGYSVLLHLRSREATRHSPVFFVSAEPPAEHAEIARALGAQGFIAKPFRIAEVCAIVRSALRDRAIEAPRRPAGSSAEGAGPAAAPAAPAGASPP